MKQTGRTIAVTHGLLAIVTHIWMAAAMTTLTAWMLTAPVSVILIVGMNAGERAILMIVMTPAMVTAKADVM